MNVYNAKHITIPEGGVKRILDRNNRVLWWDYQLYTPFYIENKGTNDAHVGFAGTPSITISYSKDLTNWNTMSTGDISVSYPTLTISPGVRFYFKARTTNWQGRKIFNAYGTKGSIYIGGNIMSLLYGDNFAGNSTITRYAFDSIFASWDGLRDASELYLPADTLDWECYASMFKSSSLIVPPELPATKLSWGCYRNMFQSTSIKSIHLPATTLELSCYEYMFSGCGSLTSITCNATNIIPYNDDYTSHWVDMISATGTFYKNPSATWSTGRDGIPSGWTVQDL